MSATFKGVVTEIVLKGDGDGVLKGVVVFLGDHEEAPVHIEMKLEGVKDPLTVKELYEMAQSTMEGAAKLLEGDQ